MCRFRLDYHGPTLPSQPFVMAFHLHYKVDFDSAHPYYSCVHSPLISEVQLDRARGGSLRAVVEAEYWFCCTRSTGAGHSGVGRGGGSAAAGWS